MPFEHEEESRNKRAQLDQQMSSLFDGMDDDDDEYIPSKSRNKSRSLFSRKSVKNSYDDSDDDYFDDDFEEEPVKPRKSRKKASKKKQKRPKKAKKPKYNDDYYDEYDDYDDLPGDDGMVFYDKDGTVLPNLQKQPVNIKKIFFTTVTIIIVLFIALLGWGWYNTDYDSEGNAYIVPLELYPERSYMNKADVVLQTILTIDESFDEDTYYLPSDYTNMYTKLTNEKNTLQEETTKLSRYVNVPSDYSNYNETLINFSLSIQECIDNLIKNKDASDYEEYREQVFTEYYADLNSVKKMRKELETQLFRNLPESESEIDLDTSNSSSSNSNSSSSSSKSSTKSSSSKSKRSSSTNSSNSSSKSSNTNNSASSSKNDDVDLLLGDNDSDSSSSSSNSTNNSNSQSALTQGINSSSDEDD